jgi:hypothetical protein
MRAELEALGTKLEAMPKHELEAFYKLTDNAWKDLLRGRTPRLIQKLVQALEERCGGAARLTRSLSGWPRSVPGRARQKRRCSFRNWWTSHPIDRCDLSLGQQGLCFD